MSRLFYLQDKRTYVGNSILWWAKDHRGYTCHLDKAHIFTEEEVLKRTRDTDVPWPKDLIDEIASRQVDMQLLPERDQIKELLP